MELQWIEPDGPEYSDWVALRETILRAPQGLRFSAADLEEEKNQRHLVAREGDEIIGGLIVIPLLEKWKIRQVVVEPSRQGEYLGFRIMEEAIIEAKRAEVDAIALHSRANVVGFYEKLGFEIVGDEFIEVGIPHRKMVLPLGSG